MNKPGKWSVRLVCPGTGRIGNPPHFTIVAKLSEDGEEFCTVCRRYRPRHSVSPYESTRRKRSTKSAESPTLATLFDDADDPPPPF